MGKIKIIIASNSFVILKGLDFILREIDDFEIIWRNADEPDLITFFHQTDADFVFLSDSMISEQEMSEYRLKFTENKYPKFIFTSERPSNHIQAEFYSDSISLQGNRNEISKRITRIIETHIPKKRNDQKSSELSEREKNIVRHIALGYTNKEIGEKLFISIHTVIAHRKNITQKLEIKTVSGLTVYAILNNIVTMEEISK